MVILLEPAQNVAMMQADPYSSPDTIWYHAVWGTPGTKTAASPRVTRPKRIRVPVGGGFCDPSLRDQPLRHDPRVVIPSRLRPALACAICNLCARRRLAIRCLSIGSNHVHTLMKLDPDERNARATIEDCKRVSALLAYPIRPEGLWNEGCELLPVRSELQFDRISRQICGDHKRGNHVWKHPRMMRDEEDAKIDNHETE